jgi:glycosyltransferase involved in cell wall biosynthesis
MTKPKLLIGIETLFSGGAESFVVNLANSLSNRYDVSLFVVFGSKIDDRLLLRQRNDFKIIKCKAPLDLFLVKLDGLLLRLKIDYSFRDAFVIARLKKIIAHGKYQILHSNQFKVDWVFYLSNLRSKIPHITTIHGDYISFHKQSIAGQLRILNFEWKAKRVLSGITGVVYISSNQLDFVRKAWNLADLDRKSRKIYNGIGLPSVAVNSKESQRKGFVFGMVARGIPDKGWESAIQAFLQLSAPDCRLMLFGESEYLTGLASKYKHEHIVFAGYTSAPLKSIESIDVGLLPTTFASESLPTTVIEYLAMGKPVIATDVGEIRNMLDQNGRISGFIIPVGQGSLNTTLVSNAMHELRVNHELYLDFSRNARMNAKTFDIDRCSSDYSEFYKSLLIKGAD